MKLYGIYFLLFSFVSLQAALESQLKSLKTLLHNLEAKLSGMSPRTNNNKVERVATAMVNELGEMAKNLIAQVRNGELSLDEVSKISTHDGDQIVTSYIQKTNNFDAAQRKEFKDLIAKKIALNNAISGLDELIISFQTMDKYLTTLRTTIPYPLSALQITNITAVIKGKLPKNNNDLVNTILNALEKTDSYKNFVNKFKEGAQRIWSAVRSVYI